MTELPPRAPDRISVVDAKRHFSRITDEVARRGRRFIVTRHGRPVLALVPVEEAEALARPRRTSGLAAAAGLLADCPELCDAIDDVWARRSDSVDRPAPTLE